jgi:hypothetical protein
VAARPLGVLHPRRDHTSTDGHWPDRPIGSCCAARRADIANTALRIFLQEMGAVYDETRGLPVYDGKKHFLTIRESSESAATAATIFGLAGSQRIT